MQGSDEPLPNGALNMAMAFLLRDVDRAAGLESMEGAGSDLGRKILDLRSAR